MNFGTNLKNYRLSKKLSQEDLAFKLGVTRQSVSKWEVGSAYPEMSNIIALCTLFNCQITDLINDKITDYEKFNEEVKEEVVKFSNKEQKKIKIVSKSIYIIARIIIAILLLPTLAITLFSLLLPIISSNIDIQNEKIVLYDKEYDIDITNTINNMGGLNINQKNITIPLIEINILYIAIFSILEILFLYYLSKLFKNVYNQNTPLSLDNENIIKRIVWILLSKKIIEILFMFIISCILKDYSNISINIKDIIEMLIIISVFYFFKYGRLVQKDSKAVIYGEKE